MNEYNKEKLKKYSNDLFSLCLDKTIPFEYYSYDMEFVVKYKNDFYTTFCKESAFLARGVKSHTKVIPIWELIEIIKNQ